MLVVWFVLVILMRLAKADERPTGYLFYTSDVINLDLNYTSYTVGCTVNTTGSVGADASIHNLMILDTKSNPYSTEIVNETTIIHEVDLRHNNESTICGVKTYICRFKRSMLAMRTIRVARPPPAIKPTDFKCISYNRKRLVCQFERQNSCGLFTEYSLSMIRLSGHSVCNLNDTGTMLSFDSVSDSCVFSSGHSMFSFRIEGKNIIGKAESTFEVDHYDIVQPEAPSNLQVLSLNETDAEITWDLSYMLYNLNRSFEVQFHLITKYDVTETFATMNLTKGEQMKYQFYDLYAYTSYELKMRVRVVPKSLRHFEEEYWSEWSVIEFQTLGCRPYDAPRILPGAYNFKERRDNLVAIDVYWEQVPEYRYNGPGFGYGIYALSQTGHSLTTNSSNNGVATFQKARIDEQYTVYLYSYNDEGRSENMNTINVYPLKAEYQPKIKRMLYNESYHLQWFSPDDSESLSNYTLMYCTYSTTGTCHGSVTFDTIPANATSYFLNLTKPLTFAISANYREYSTELSWQLCTVSPAMSISQLAFKVTDVSEHSFTLRLQLSCMDQSLIERFDVRYWAALDANMVVNKTFRPYDTIIPIENLSIDTDYAVIVTVYDERGNTFEARSSVRTKDKDILMQLVPFLLLGILVMGIVTTTATRKVKRIMDIKVEIPIGLLGIHEMPIQIESSHEEHEPIPEHFGDAIELEELSPNEDQPFVKVKSILKKPEQFASPTNPEQTDHSIKPKPTVQIVTGDNYIMPSQMMDPAKTMPSIIAIGGAQSSGYVDVKLMMNQQRVV